MKQSGRGCWSNLGTSDGNRVVLRFVAQEVSAQLPALRAPRTGSGRNGLGRTAGIGLCGRIGATLVQISFCAEHLGQHLAGSLTRLPDA